MEKGDMKNFISTKVDEHLKDVQIFFSKVQDDQKKMEANVTEVKKIKSEATDDSFERARPLMVEVQELHYNNFLLNQAVQQSQNLLFEYNIMAKLFGVVLKLEGEDKAFFESVTSNNPHMFRIEKGEVIMIESEETAVAMGALSEKMSSDETLKAMYNGF